MSEPQESSKIHRRTFLSLFVVIGSMLSLVFLQMEERRLGYSVLLMNKEFRKLSEQRQRKDYHFQKLTRPQYVEKLASLRKELKKVKPEQVIHMTGAQK